MYYMQVTPESTPEQRAEAMVYITHPCDEHCCPEAEYYVDISIYLGDDPDPHNEVSSQVKGFLSLDDVEKRTRAVIAAIIADAERRAMLRAAAIAGTISPYAAKAILARTPAAPAAPERTP